MARSDMYRKLPWTGGDARSVAEIVNNLVEGKSNNTGDITLVAGGASSTTIYDERIGYNSVLTLIRPSVDNGSANVQVASRRMLDDTITYGSSVSATAEDRCSVRSAGRYHRIALTPTGANWSSAIGMDIEYSEQGTR